MTLGPLHRTSSLASLHSQVLSRFESETLPPSPRTECPSLPVRMEEEPEILALSAPTLRMIEEGPRARAVAAPEPAPRIAEHVMPQVAETLSLYRAVLRQAPAFVLTLSALGAIAAGVWAFLRAQQLLLAAAVALELVSLLGFWLNSQWRETADLACRMDAIANNALQQGNTVLDTLREENRELGGALDQLRQTNEQLRASLDRMAQEREQIVMTMRQTDAQLEAFRSAEQQRLSVIEGYHRMREELSGFVATARDQLQNETFWQEMQTAFCALLERVDEVLQHDQGQALELAHLGQLAEQIRTLRDQMSRQASDPAPAPIQEALERSSWLCSDLSHRLLEQQAIHARLLERLEFQELKAQKLEQTAEIVLARCERLERRLAGLTHPSTS